jgi:GNAT superfamily N-acetyltransferase
MLQEAMMTTVRSSQQFEAITHPQQRSPESEAHRARVLTRAEAFTRPFNPLTTDRLQAGLPVPSGHVSLIAPDPAQWGAFDSGDTQINTIVLEAITDAQQGLVALYGLTRGDTRLAVVTLQAGLQRADPSILDSLDGWTSVPTLIIPVIAVHRDHQRQGIGRQLMDVVISVARARAPYLGITTLSLTSTPGSDAFFTAVGFERDEVAAPDGTRARWLRLQ